MAVYPKGINEPIITLKSLDIRQSSLKAELFKAETTEVSAVRELRQLIELIVLIKSQNKIKTDLKPKDCMAQKFIFLSVHKILFYTIKHTVLIVI